MAGVNIATAYVDIIPSIKGIRNETKKMMGEFDKAGKKSSGLFSSAFAGGVGGVVAVATMKALSSIRTGIANTVKSFSDLEDATGAAEVVFGKSMSRIISLSEKAHRTMGMTKAQVIDASNTFGVFGQSAGLTGNKLANFSIDLTKLAGDLSSFKGGSVEDAIIAIGAALRGESEPIRRYGVLLDDLTVKQQALKMGLIKTTKEALTPQNRTLAVSRLLFEQTRLAQGDFERTLVSTQNTAKTFQASITNAIASFGGVYAPLISMGKRIGTEVFDSLGRKFDILRLKNTDTFNRMRANLEVFLSGKADSRIFEALDVDPNSVNSDKIVGLRVRFNENVRRMRETLESLFRPTWESIKKSFTTPISPKIDFGAISGVDLPQITIMQPIQGLIKAIVDNAPQIGQAMSKISDALIKAFITIAPSLAKILPVIAEAFVKLVPAITPIIPLLADLTIKFLDLITPILQNESLLKMLGLAFVGFKISGVVASVFKFGQGLVSNISKIKEFVTTGGGLFGRLHSVVDTVRLKFMYFTDSARKIGLVLRSGLGTVIRSITTGVKLFGNVIVRIGSILRVVLGGALRVATVGFRVLSVVLRANPIGIVITVIMGLVSAVIYLWNNCQWFRNAVYQVWDTLKGWASWLGSVFVAIWGVLPSAITNAISRAWNTVTGWGSSIVGFFSGLGSTLYNSGASVINGFWNGMKSVWNKLTGWVKQGLEYVRSFFPFSPAKRGPFSGKGWVYYSGKSIGEALGKGIYDSQYVTIGASKSMLQATRSVYDTQNASYKGLSVAPNFIPTSNNKSGVVVNIHSETTSTAEQIAREVTWELQKQ